MIAEPDSPLAREAHDRARTSLSAAIYNHSRRAFQLGAAAAEALGKPFDAETLYVDALLHDLGFGEPPERERSFEIVGADLARALVGVHDRAQADRVWHAIAVHTVPHLARAGDAETLLLHLGSAADAFGLRLPIAEAVIDEIETVFPRGALAAELDALTDAHAAVHRFGQLAAFRALGMKPRAA